MHSEHPLSRGGSPRADAPARDSYTQVEHDVARTADLVLKVHRLLEQAGARESEPSRDLRIARLTWVVERGRAALVDATGGDAAVVALPSPRGRG